MRHHRWTRWFFPVTGLLSLIWFLFRVVPKPSRASYPCQRAAAPLAGSFLVWMAALMGSAALYRRGRNLWRQSRLVLACACLASAGALVIGSLVSVPQPSLRADVAANQPIGTGMGVFPGRVVWAHDPEATKWEGPGHGHWWESAYSSQAAADGMMSRAIRRLSGQSTDARAWETLIRNFNQTHARGNAGYRRGEKIVIKVNLVGCIIRGGVDPATHDLVRRVDYMNTSPQMIVALLRQLVREAGVSEEDISVGDPLSLFPNQYYDYCQREFPKVRYLDHDGGDARHPRTPVAFSTVPLYWSTRPVDKTPDYVPTSFAEAKYLINMANLKSHASAGVTLCGKNHYGSLFRTPPQKGYFDMHGSLAREVKDWGHYRALVDLMGHAHIGGKTLVCMIDGLYPGVHPTEMSPRRFSSAPFNGHWASSLFVSQDQVAIDSVGFDFLYAEWNDYPHLPGADDYLHEAALANNPPSGTFYDPNHPVNTTRLASLGVHEHWNNAKARQYSRNLGKSEGIELVQAETAR
jgi:hypothetical protein